MKQRICFQEQTVLRAVRTGFLPETLANHLSECASCREAVDAARWMDALVNGAASDATLPDSKLIWWNAQLAQRGAGAENHRALLEWFAILSAAVIPLFLAGWVVWNWFGIQEQVIRLIGPWLPEFWFAFALASLAPALLFAAALSLAYPAFTRD